MAKSGSLSGWTLLRIFIGVLVFVIVSLWLRSPAGQMWIVSNIMKPYHAPTSVSPRDVADLLTLILGLLVFLFIVGIPQSKETSRRHSNRPYREEVIYDTDDEEEDWLEPMRDLDRRMKEFDSSMFDSFQSSSRRRSSKRRRKSKKDDDWFAPMRDFKF